ncbi:hypothetical protein L9F63_025912, partial [Diploptera punctata]
GLAILVIYIVVADSLSTQSSIRRPNEYLAPPPLPRRLPTRLHLLKVDNSTVSKTSPSAAESTVRNARWLAPTVKSEPKSERNELIRSQSAAKQLPEDQVASGTHLQVQSVALTHQIGGGGRSKKECNPCNKVPWIPMTRSLFDSDTHYQHSPILSQYDSPPIGSLPLQTPGTSYGAPLPPLQPPPPPTSSNHPVSEYGPPPEPPKSIFNPPPSGHNSINAAYGPHSIKAEYGPPPSASQSINTVHAAPPQNHPISEYGPPPEPPKSIYNPTPSGPHSIKAGYGPPPSASQPIQTTFIWTSTTSYASIKPANVPPLLHPPSVKPAYGPPSTSPQGPKSVYAPPPKPLKTSYGTPAIQTYQLPTSPSNNIGSSYAPPPPPLKLNHVPPTPHKYPSNEYAPPPQLSLSINQQYGPPRSPVTSLKDEYGLPPPLPPPHHPTGFGHHLPSNKPARAPTSQFGNYGSPTKPTTSQYGPPISPALPIPKPPRHEYESPSQSSSTVFKPPPPTSYDAVKQQSSPQLSPSYLPVPPVHDASNFREESHSTHQNFVTSSPHFSSDSSGFRGNGDYNSINIVPSVPLIEDSHPVASHNPTTSSPHVSSYTDVSSIHLFLMSLQLLILTQGIGIKKLPDPQMINYIYHLEIHIYHILKTIKITTKANTQDPSLEVIPSVQVTDFLSSIEYPLQIIQSPYIDVTESPAENQDSSHSSSHSHSTYDEGEIIVGKPTIENAKINDTTIQSQSSSIGFDQKEQQSVVHVTNTTRTVSDSISNLSAPGIIHSSQGNGFFISDNQVKSINENHQEGQIQDNVSTLDAPNNNQNASIVQIQPSLQTSVEGNSIIHQINDVFQSQNNKPGIPPYHNNFRHFQSGYVLFQNFPQPPLSHLPEDVLKQKLPPPAPFQNNFQKNPYLPPFQSQSSHHFAYSTPQPQTTNIPQALKLEASGSFFESAP